MSYQPFDRNPSGIVFFTNGGTEPVYDSDSNFILATGSPGYIQAPNLRISNGGKIGSVSATGAIDIASNGNVTFSQDVSVAGSLVVNGTLTSVNTDNIIVKDPLILLSSGNIANTNDIGFFGQYSTSNYLGLFSDASDSNKFKLFTGLTAAPTTTVNTGGAGYTVGTLVANLEGNVTGNSTTATTLQNSRFIGVSGMMTGSGLFNGSADQVPNITAHHSLITAQTAATTSNSTDEILIASGTSLRKITRSNFISGLGAMSSFIVSDGSTTETINDGNTLLFRSGAAINFTVSSTDSVSGTLNAAVAGSGLSMTNQVLNINVASGIQIANDTVRATASSGIVVDSNGIRVNLNSYATQSASLAAISNTSNRSYVIQPNASDQLVVNVPWGDTTYEAGVGLEKDPLTGTSFTFRAVAGSGIIVDANGIHTRRGSGLALDGNGLRVGAGNGITVAANSVAVTDGSGIIVNGNGVHANLRYGTVQSTDAAASPTTTASRTYGIQVNSSDQLVVNVPWTDTTTNFTISDGTNTQTINNSDTLRFQSGAAINFTVSATDTVSGTLNAAVAGSGLSMTNQVLNINVASGIQIANDTVRATAGSGLTVDANGLHVVAGTGLLNTAAGLQIGIGNGITGAADAISVTAGTGITVNSNGVHLNYIGASNFVNVATTTAAASDDFIIFHDVTDSNVKKVTLANLPVSSGIFQTANFIDSATIDFTVVPFVSVSGDVRDASITNVKVASGTLNFDRLQNGSALSVLGVTSNISRNNDSIVAGTDNQVLRRSGTTVAFGAVNLASSDAVTGDLPFANLTQGSALSVLGVTGNATTDVASISASTDGTVLRRSGTTLGFGTVTVSGISDGAVTEDKRLRNVVTVFAGLLQSIVTGDILLCDASSGPIGISALPSHSPGKIIRIKKTDPSTNIVTLPSLDGGPKILYSQYESFTVVSHSNAWHII